MSLTFDNIAFTYDDEVLEEVKDPLENLDTYVQNPLYYRLNETIFAEPITHNNGNAVNATEAVNDVYFINNLPVKKRNGKRKKHLIDVNTCSSYPKCPQINCDKTFSTTTLLRAHMRRVHGADPTKYMCEHCAAGFSARYLLHRHMAVHGDQRAECPVCGKMLSKRTSMSVHLRRHTNARPHACHQCDRSFVRRAALTAHLRFVHRTGELRCQRCGEGFSSRKHFMSHKSCREK